MASAAELAILLTVEGADTVDKAVDSVSSKLGGIGKVAAVGVAGIATAAVGAGAALLGVGAKFDDAFDGMAVKTGATGQALAGLQDSFKNVIGNTPADFETVSAAMGTLSQRTGATGKELETLTTQVADLSRITGVDATAAATAAADVFAKWGTTGADQGKVMDQLFVASQQTGIGFEDLAASVTTNASALQAGGLGMRESIGLISNLKSAGIDASEVMPKLGKAMAKMVKEGQDPAEGLSALFDTIKAEGPNSAAAIEALGPAGLKLAAGIASGKVELGAFSEALASSSGAISDTATSTADFGERMDMMKNKVLVALEPLGSAVMDGVGGALDAVMPLVDSVTAGFSKFVEMLQSSGEWSSSFGETITTALGEVLGVDLSSFSETINSIVDYFVSLKDTIMGIDWAAIGETVKTFAGYFMDGLGVVIPIVSDILQNVLLPVLSTVFGFLMDHKELLAAVGIAFLALSGPIGAVVVAITAIGLIVPKIKEWWASVSADTTAAWDGIGAAISGAWESIKTGISDALAAVGDFITGAWEGYLASVQANLDAIQAVIIGIWNLIPEDIRVRLELIATLILAKWTEYKETITTALESVRVFISAKWDAIGEYLSSKLEAIGKVVTDAWEAVKATITDALAKVQEVVNTVWTWVGDFIHEALNKIQDVFISVMDFIESKTGISMQAVKDNFDNAITVVHDIVDAFVAFFTGDWEGMFDAIQRATDNAWTAIKGYFSTGWQAIKDLLKIDELVAIFDGLGDKLGTAVGKITDGLKTAFSNAWDTFKAWVTQKVSGFLDGIIGGLIGGKGGGGSTPAPGGPGGANAFNPNGMRMPGGSFGGLGGGISPQDLGAVIGQAAGASLSLVLAPLLLEGRAAPWDVNAKSANGRMGLQKGPGIADKPTDNGVRADAFRSGRGGLLAASSSNYWQVFVQRFGVPTEASARKVSKQLGIPLPKWLEDIFHPPQGETVDAPDALKDPAPAVEVGKAFNNLAGEANNLAGAFSKMAPVGIDLDVLRGSAIKLRQNFDDLAPIIGGIVKALPPGSGGRGGIGIPIPGPGGSTTFGGGSYGPGTVTLMSQSATLAGPVSVGFTGTFQVASGRSLAVELVEATITDTPSLDKLIRAMDQRKAQKGP